MMLRASSLQLLAVVAAETAPRALIALNLLDQGREGEAKAVAAGDVVAVLLSARGRTVRGRRRLRGELASFHEALAAVHAEGPCLPAAPGAVFEGGSEAARFLAANAPLLTQGLAQCGETEQQEIAIEFPAAAMLAQLRDRPAFVEARSLLASGDRAAAARLLPTAIADERARLRNEWTLRLADKALAVAPASAPNGDVVLHLALQAKRGDHARFEGVLGSIQEAFDGGLTVRRGAATAASAFARIVVERPEPEAIRAAAARLGVAETADAASVEAAYQRLVRRLAEEGDRSDVAMRTLDGAYELLSRVSAAYDALRAAGDGSRATPSLAYLANDGERTSTEIVTKVAA